MITLYMSHVLNLQTLIELAQEKNRLKNVNTLSIIIIMIECDAQFSRLGIQCPCIHAFFCVMLCVYRRGFLTFLVFLMGYYVVQYAIHSNSCTDN